MTQRWKITGLIAAAAISLTALLLTLFAIKGPEIGEFLAFRRIPSKDQAAQRAAFHKWRNERLTLPADALVVTPFTSATQAAARAFDAVWTQDEKQTKGFAALEDSFKKGTADNLAYADLTAALVPLAPLVEAFTAVVSRPDYNTRAFASGCEREQYELPMTRWVAVIAGARLARLGARAALHEGRFGDALRLAETSLRVARCDRYASPLEQMIAPLLLSEGVTTLHEFILRCPDPALLRRSLATQNTIARQCDFNTSSSFSFRAQESLVMLRELKRRGISVEIGNPTTMELFGQSLAGRARFIESRVVPMVQSDPAQLKAACAMADQFRSTAAKLGVSETSRLNSFLRLKAGFDLPVIYLSTYAEWSSKDRRLVQKDLAARCRLDLLRLATARRLYVIEHGNNPAKTADLVPKYLPEIPLDRFAKLPAPYQESSKGYYSVGPDGRDDGNLRPYDDTRSTQQGVDLSLD